MVGGGLKSKFEKWMALSRGDGGGAPTRKSGPPLKKGALQTAIQPARNKTQIHTGQEQKKHRHPKESDPSDPKCHTQKNKKEANEERFLPKSHQHSCG